MIHYNARLSLVKTRVISPYVTTEHEICDPQSYVKHFLGYCIKCILPAHFVLQFVSQRISLCHYDTIVTSHLIQVYPRHH